MINILGALFCLGLSVAVGFTIFLKALFKASGLWAPVGRHWIFLKAAVLFVDDVYDYDFRVVF